MQASAAIDDSVHTLFVSLRLLMMMLPLFLFCHSSASVSLFYFPPFAHIHPRPSFSSFANGPPFTSLQSLSLATLAWRYSLCAADSMPAFVKRLFATCHALQPLYPSPSDHSAFASAPILKPADKRNLSQTFHAKPLLPPGSIGNY